MILMEGVSKRYKTGMLAVSNVNLHVERGDFIFLVGPSGAGKSSVIKMLLKEENCTKGRIVVDDLDITNLHRRRVPMLRRKIGVVFQDYRLLEKKTVFENVAFAMEIVGASSREIRTNVPMILSVVGLADKQKFYPNQLSGGEQQRVSIARAMINNPPILVADEPTGNLDPDTAWDIMMILKQINRRGTTILMATHDKKVVDIMKQRVVAMENGRIIRDEIGGQYGYAN